MANTYAAEVNTIYRNLENSVVANDGSHFYSRQTSLEPSWCETKLIKFNNRQDLVNFITEQNWRYFTYFQQLDNAYNKVFNQAMALREKHNAAVSAFKTAKADTTYSTQTTIDGNTVDSAGTDTTKTATDLQTAYLEKLIKAVSGTFGTWKFAYNEANPLWCYAPHGHYGWFDDCKTYYNCLASSWLKYDGLYDGSVCGMRFRMKLPDYVFPSLWNDGTFTSQAGSMTDYENLWKAYYNTLINAAANVRSGASVTSKYLIDQCKAMSVPKKYYDIRDGSGGANATVAIVTNNLTSGDTYSYWVPESSAGAGFVKALKNMAKDMIDWKYNRVPTMIAPYVTQANAALEYLKKKDSTGEFEAWVNSSGFKIHQNPYGATLVYNDYTGGQHLENSKWNDKTNKYYAAYSPCPTNLTYWNPFNRDLYCAKSDLDSGRIKINKGDY
jgi:hypothetical protein